MMFKTLINTEQLLAHLEHSDWVIVDCRFDLMEPDAGRKQYQQAHVKGALFADVHDDLSGPPVTDHGRHPLPSEELLNSLFSNLGIRSNSQVVVYDDVGGSFAARLWWLLRYMGHEAVALLDGGWQAWQREAQPTASGIEKIEVSHYQGAAQTQCLVTLANLDSARQLIDSRDPQRYRGEVEPIDKAAGHIPGAINHFWKENLAEEHYFKTAEELRSQFQELMIVESRDTVFYCGSGVTACHNLLAVSHAGLDMPRLYAGSWSEWCSDEKRPVATGDEA